MKYTKGDVLICIKDSPVRHGNSPTINRGEIVEVQDIGIWPNIWFKHSYELGGNYDANDFILQKNQTYEIY